MKPNIYVWIVEQDGEHRIRKWDTKPFGNATHFCVYEASGAIALFDPAQLEICHAALRDYRDSLAKRIPTEPSMIIREHFINQIAECQKMITDIIDQFGGSDE